MHPGRLKAFTLSLRGGVGADLAQAREFLATMGLEMYLESIEAEPGSLDPLEAVRVIEDYKPLDVESAAMTLGAPPRHSRAIPRLAASRGWRRRRRKPEGLSDRGKPGADDPQRPPQSDAVSGRLGRREDEALGDVLRRPEPFLQPDVGSPAPMGLRGVQPLHAPDVVVETAEAIPFVDDSRVTTTNAFTRSRARSCPAASPRSPDVRCRSSRSAAFRTAVCHRRASTLSRGRGRVPLALPVSLRVIRR